MCAQAATACIQARAQAVRGLAPEVPALEAGAQRAWGPRNLVHHQLHHRCAPIVRRAWHHAVHHTVHHTVHHAVHHTASSSSPAFHGPGAYEICGHPERWEAEHRTFCQEAYAALLRGRSRERHGSPPLPPGAGTADCGCA